MKPWRCTQKPEQKLLAKLNVGNDFAGAENLQSLPGNTPRNLKCMFLNVMECNSRFLGVSAE